MTRQDAIMAEIAVFTTTVVAISEMRGVSIKDKANAIFSIERVLHKIIMDNMSDVADSAVTCSSN